MAFDKSAVLIPRWLLFLWSNLILSFTAFSSCAYCRLVGLNPMLSAAHCSKVSSLKTPSYSPALISASVSLYSSSRSWSNFRFDTPSFGSSFPFCFGFDDALFPFCFGSSVGVSAGFLPFEPFVEVSAGFSPFGSSVEVSAGFLPFEPSVEVSAGVNPRCGSRITVGASCSSLSRCADFSPFEPSVEVSAGGFLPTSGTSSSSPEVASTATAIFFFFFFLFFFKLPGSDVGPGDD